MTVRPWGLAIDFGTTATAAVTVIGDHVSLLSLDGAGRMPSSVYATGDDGALLVGKQADNQSAYALDRYEETPKRLIQKPSVRLGDRQFKPVELITAIMAHVLSEALGQHNNSPPSWLVLTHPVAWASSQRQVLGDAVRAAAHELEVSLPSPAFVAEPVAAAQWYASGAQHDPPEVGQAFAVYDLGGGTFDVAILRRTEHGYAEINRGSLDPLGGYDFDYRLFAYLGNKYIAKEDAELWRALQRPEAGDVDMAERRRQMRSNVQDLKERLSGKPSIETRLRGVAQPVLVTRDDLETLIVADVDRTIDELLTTLDECGLEPSDLAVIYRVGGASRIPLVGRKLEALGVPVYSEDDPKLVVAKGAALSPDVKFAVPAPPPPPEPPPEPPPTPAPEPEPEPAPASRAEVIVDTAQSSPEAQAAGSGLGRWAWAAVVTGAALLAAAVASAVSWLPTIGFGTIGISVIAVVGVLLTRRGPPRVRRAFTLIAVTSALAAVTGFFVIHMPEAVLGACAVVGGLLVVLPQWRGVPSRGAVTGLAVGGIVTAAAGAMSVVAEEQYRGRPNWSLSDAVVIAVAVVLVACGVLAGRRRKRQPWPPAESPPVQTTGNRVRPWIIGCIVVGIVALVIVVIRVWPWGDELHREPSGTSTPAATPTVDTDARQIQTSNTADATINESQVGSCLWLTLFPSSIACSSAGVGDYKVSRRTYDPGECNPDQQWIRATDTKLVLCLTPFT